MGTWRRRDERGDVAGETSNRGTWRSLGVVDSYNGFLNGFVGELGAEVDEDVVVSLEWDGGGGANGSSAGGDEMMEGGRTAPPASVNGFVSSLPRLGLDSEDMRLNLNAPDSTSALSLVLAGIQPPFRIDCFESLLIPPNVVTKPVTSETIEDGVRAVRESLAAFRRCFSMSSIFLKFCSSH